VVDHRASQVSLVGPPDFTTAWSSVLPSGAPGRSPPGRAARRATRTGRIGETCAW